MYRKVSEFYKLYYKNKINIIEYNEKGKKHGYCEMYWWDELWYKRFYINDKEYGYEEYYLTNKIELRFYL